MFKKICGVAVKIFTGIVVFYFVLSWIVVPLFAPWIARSLGTKTLKNKVQLRSVTFNPFLWRLTARDFSILDSKEVSMIGFDTLSVDVSFLKLFQKEYRVELARLEGFKIHAVLMGDNQINLTQLIPDPPSEAATVPNTQPNESQKSDEPLPLVVVDAFVMSDSQVRFVDQNVQPPFDVIFDQMSLELRDFSTDPARQASIKFQTLVNGKGKITTDTVVKPLADPLDLEATFVMDDYALQTLTPYVGKFTGRGVKDGKMNLKMVYRIHDNKLTASHQLLVERFDFGEKIESKDVVSLPYGLALALLEDPQGRIKIALPVTGDMSDPEFHYWHLLGQVARNFFMKLVTKPFSFLASVLGSESGTEDMGYIRFAPGRADLTDEEKEKLKLIAQGLIERPRILVQINGSYDPDLDWKAMKSDVFDQNYFALREESKKTERAVYEQLYQRRFGLRDLWALARKYQLKDGAYDTAGFMAEAKRQLIEEGAPDTVALEALAQRRAQLIHEFLIAQNFDARRVSLGVARTTQGSMGDVALELVLTVFDKEEQIP